MPGQQARVFTDWELKRAHLKLQNWERAHRELEAKIREFAEPFLDRANQLIQKYPFLSSRQLIRFIRF
jgi:hypothetical protein